MPPSPSLSARNTKEHDFTEITKTNTQKINDKTPNILSDVMGNPDKDSRNAYKGLVPISPNTTPSAASDRNKNLLLSGEDTSLSFSKLIYLRVSF